MQVTYKYVRPEHSHIPRINNGFRVKCVRHTSTWKWRKQAFRFAKWGPILECPAMAKSYMSAVRKGYWSLVGRWPVDRGQKGISGDLNVIAKKASLLYSGIIFEHYYHWMSVWKSHTKWHHAPCLSLQVQLRLFACEATTFPHMEARALFTSTAECTGPLFEAGLYSIRDRPLNLSIKELKIAWLYC